MLSYSPLSAKVELRRSENGNARIVNRSPVTSQANEKQQTNTYELEPATYSLIISADGYETTELIHTIQPDVTARLEVVLEPLSQLNRPPTAAFSATPESGEGPLEVVLDAAASRDTDGKIVRYSWDLGDGSTAEGVSVRHSYFKPGDYKVVLTVIDNKDATNSSSKTISVNAPPVASFAVSYEGDSIPMTVQFDATSSQDTDGQIADYTWDFGDGSSGKGAKASHTYREQGAFTATLTVTDDKGSTATLREFIYIGVEPPRAQFRFSPDKATAPQEISFDASASYSSNGDIISYLWEFGDGSSASGKIVKHRFTTHGHFNVVLTIEDSKGVPAKKQETLYINGAPSAQFTHDKISGKAPLKVSFDAGKSSDPENNLVHYEWSFGDGSSAKGRTVEHTFGQVGTFSVELTVTDGLDAQDTSTSQIEVKNTPPTPLFELTPNSGFAPLDIKADASASSDLNDSIQSYAWDFGDGTVKTGRVVNHRYAKADNYKVTLTVTDSHGATASLIKEVFVKKTPPVAKFSVSNAKGSAPHTVTFDASESHDPDGTITSYEWTDSFTARGQTVTHTFTKEGIYTVKLNVTDNDGTTKTVSKKITVTPSYRLEPLSVSSDGHAMYSGNKPFFWLADTAWLLWTTTTEEDVILYLDDALSKGFTVIQVALTAAWSGNGDNSENVFGNAPYLNNDPTRPNLAYFNYVEWVIDEAAKRGLYVAITFGEPGRLADGRIRYRIDSIEEGYDYGNAIGQHLSKWTLQNKIIWLNGQDQSGNKGLGPDMWTAMAEGLTDGVNKVNRFDGNANYSSTFMTHHPNGCCSSSSWFHSSDWLDFNGIQTWKNYSSIVRLVETDYNLTPSKPTTCLENTYEDHHYDGEYRGEWHVRFQAYWCTLAGATGYAYGHLNGYNLTRSPEWPAFFEKPGRRDMLHFKTVLTSRSIIKRVPDQSLIVSDDGSSGKAKTFIAAARANDNSYAFIYSTQGLSFDLNLNKLSGSRVKAQWFNPREGTYTNLGTLNKGSSVSFNPPGEPGEGNDWLLVLDAVN